MNTNPLEAYRAAQNNDNLSGREIEARALTHCAILLKKCQRNWDAADHVAALADPQPEKLKIIIDINLNLAAGLRGSGAD